MVKFEIASKCCSWPIKNPLKRVYALNLSCHVGYTQSESATCLDINVEVVNDVFAAKDFRKKDYLMFQPGPGSDYQ